MKNLDKRHVQGMNESLVKGKSCAEENGSVGWNGGGGKDTKEEAFHNQNNQASSLNQFSRPPVPVGSLHEALAIEEEPQRIARNTSPKIVPSSAESCPLFLCSGALPKDFATSTALKISGVSLG